MKRITLTIFIVLFVSILLTQFTYAQNVSSVGMINATSSESIKNSNKSEKIRTVVDKELDKKIEDLKKLTIRMSEFKNISDLDKEASILIVEGLIDSLNSLRFEIDNSLPTTTVKEARELVAKNYRIYALVIPQFNTIAYLDRMKTMISMMKIVEAKLQVRVGNLATSSQITSSNIASAQKNLTLINTKLNEADKSIEEVIALVMPLVPDQGDKAVMESNLATLKQARIKVKEAYLNLVLAKKSAESIVKLLTKDPKNVGKVATSTVETN